MQYSVKDNGANSSISLSGKMGFSDNEAIRSLIGELRALSAKSITADLSALTDIDSAGVGMLLLLEEAGKESGYKFVIKGVQGRVERVLEVCKLSEVIKII